MKYDLPDEVETEFNEVERPHIGLITNHGYGGVDIPIGGAPDTGGQNVYVNALANSLDRLGFKVTIYARGGFPFYESDRVREGQEMLTPHVRYVYVPGGGDTFIRKEDISVALIEELEWIYHQINGEASRQHMFPWQYYDLINTHYWDAGILGVSLVVRWQNDLASRMIRLLLRDVIPEEGLQKFDQDKHFHFISKAPEFYLGKLLLENTGVDSYVYKEETMLEAFHQWSVDSPFGDQVEGNIDKHIDWLNLRSTIAAETIQLRPLILAKVLGTAILDQEIKRRVFDDDAFRRYRSHEDIVTYHDLLRQALLEINRHAWTPHSLGVIKERNFRKKSKEINRDLKFRERRSHERVICDYTPAFAATSYEIAESLITNFGVNIDDVLFFPPGVDVNTFRQYPEEEMETLYVYLKDKTGLDVEKIRNSIILFETSRMDFTKRKDVILKAFSKMDPEVSENCLLLIGGGPEENEVFISLKEMLDETAGLKEQAFLLGFIEDEFLPRLFSLCDIYVSASEMEGFGMSVAQAAMIGKPVISSNKIPFTSFYLPEEAEMVKAGDVAGFSKAMQEMITNEEDRQRRGEASSEKAMSLEWDNLTRNFIIYLNKKNFDIPVTENITQNLHS